MEDASSAPAHLVTLAHGRRCHAFARDLVRDLRDVGVRILVATEDPSAFHGAGCECLQLPPGPFHFRLKSLAVRKALELHPAVLLIDADTTVAESPSFAGFRTHLRPRLPPGLHSWLVASLHLYRYPAVEAAATARGWTFDRSRITLQEKILGFSAHPRMQAFLDGWDVFSADLIERRVDPGTGDGTVMALAAFGLVCRSTATPFSDR